MNKFKSIFIILVTCYVLVHLYLDIFGTSTQNNDKELTRIINYGDGLISGKYNFYNRYSADVSVSSANEGIKHNSDCIRNMRLKQIGVDGSSYIAIYRGSDSNGTIMCELSVYTESEGKTAGELLASVAWFKTSDIDKFPLGGASRFSSRRETIYSKIKLLKDNLNRKSLYCANSKPSCEKKIKQLNLIKEQLERFENDYKNFDFYKSFECGDMLLSHLGSEEIRCDKKRYHHRKYIPDYAK